MLLPLPGESVEAAEAVSHTFNHVIYCLPEFDHAIKAITEASQKLQNETVRLGYIGLSLSEIAVPSIQDRTIASIAA